MLEKVKQFVDESFGKKIDHFERTLYWSKYLNPDADEALQIAAYAHDIERISGTNDKLAFLLDPETLKNHQVKGGEIIYDFLIKNGADRKLAKKVNNLVSHHEDGGTPDQNLIKDADSISYLEVNAPKHIKWIGERGFTKTEIKTKFDYMFNRISSGTAKRIAKPMYKKALADLDKLK